MMLVKFALLSSFLVTTFCQLPKLNDLDISWTSQPLRDPPIVTNFYGGINLHRDMISLGPITSSPFNGNFKNSSILVNGEKIKEKTSTWGSCESERSGISDSIKVVNKVRAPFERHGFMQQWSFSNAQTAVDLSLFLDGPLYRTCDVITTQGSIWSSCGWGTRMPIDKENFNFDLIENNQIMTIKDTLTETYTSSIVFVANELNHDFYTSNLQISLDDANSYNSSLNAAKEMRNNFYNQWNSACINYEKRFHSAFDTSYEHFSGNLPTLESNDKDLNRLYYWSSLALISLERTQLKTFPRQFVISEGQSNSLDGGNDMGGTGQFIWDLSFTSISLSLLEPEGTRSIIVFLIKYSDLSSTPMAIPQAWDAYEESLNGLSLGVYCFDYLASFFFIHQYISYTNDVAFLSESVVNIHDSSKSITIVEYMKKLAWAFKSYPTSVQSKYLADYGSDKRSFLEAVSTYTNVIPALQFGNAGMLLALSDLLESDPIFQTSNDEISYMRGNASAIVGDTIKYQYSHGTGFWNCLNISGEVVPVLAISDFDYLGLSLNVLARRIDELLPQELRDESAQFFMTDLLANGWVRAISLNDQVMKNVNSKTPNVEDKLAMRADWTGTGAYGGLAGIAIDSLVDLKGDFELALISLRNISLASRVTMPAQGIAIMSPPFMVEFLNNNDGIDIPSGPFASSFPEFFDSGSWGHCKEGNVEQCWPSSMRSLAASEAALVDSFIRSIFGYRPNWIEKSNNFLTVEEKKNLIDKSIFLPNVSRGDFHGVLKNVKTPYGLIDITASKDGVKWQFVENPYVVSLYQNYAIKNI